MESLRAGGHALGPPPPQIPPSIGVNVPRRPRNRVFSLGKHAFSGPGPSRKSQHGEFYPRMARSSLGGCQNAKIKAVWPRVRSGMVPRGSRNRCFPGGNCAFSSLGPSWWCQNGDLYPRMARSRPGDAQTGEYEAGFALHPLRDGALHVSVSTISRLERTCGKPGSMFNVLDVSGARFGNSDVGFTILAPSEKPLRGKCAISVDKAQGITDAGTHGAPSRS